MSSSGSRGRRVLMGGLVAAAGIAAAVVVLVVGKGAPLSGDPALREAFAERGVVAVTHVDVLGGLAPRGTRLVDVATLPAVRDALAGKDPARLARALEAARVSAIAVNTRDDVGEHVSARLSRLEYVPGMRGLYLGARAALYTPEPLAALAEPHRQAMATVARRLLEGARPPRITSFPEPLRQVRHVEVMVLLKQGPRPRLWRSARGSSLGRALVTASTVARERWQERQAAMGGPLDGILPRLSVEVALLLDDGTLGEREAAFVDRAVTRHHGVAYERKGAWRYLLPAATAKEGRGRASVALAALFEDNGLSRDSLDKSDVRPYRLAVTTLAVSPPTRPDVGDGDTPAARSAVVGRDAAVEDDPFEVTDPAEVLE